MKERMMKIEDYLLYFLFPAAFGVLLLLRAAFIFCPVFLVSDVDVQPFSLRGYAGCSRLRRSDRFLADRRKNRKMDGS